MIERINSQINVGVDKATKKAADALERVTDRLSGKPDNAVDTGVSFRLKAAYNENYLTARNLQDSISYLQTRDGYLKGISDSLMRMRELAVQMGSPALSESDKQIVRDEAGMIMEDISSVSRSAEFNSHKLAGDVSLSSLGLDRLTFGARGTIEAVDKALSTVNARRAEAGAQISTIEARLENLSSANVNLVEAIENRAGSLNEDILELTDSVSRALISAKAADIVMDIDKKKIRSLLDIS